MKQARLSEKHPRLTQLMSVVTQAKGQSVQGLERVFEVIMVFIGSNVMTFRDILCSRYGHRIKLSYTCFLASASCICYGDPHCKTFDDVRFDYQGTCRYNLASVNIPVPGQPYFQVFSENEYRFGIGAVSYVKYVDIVYATDTVRLSVDYLSRAAVPVNILVGRLIVIECKAYPCYVRL
jgi:hypothetical protein